MSERSSETYSKPGLAHFDCPRLRELQGGRHHSEIPPGELRAQRADGAYELDGQGHSTWSFQWSAGAYRLSHAANGGGPPRCAGCGELLVFVAGDDPEGE